MKPIKLVYSLWFMVERLKKQKTRIFVLLIFLLLSTINYQPSTAFAAIPKLINYQGRLLDSQGQPITGTKSVTFRIYDVESGGSPLWQETHTTTFDKGIFNLFIGGVTPLNLAFDKQYWLGIQVGSDPEMSPRQRLASSAYAFRANEADKAKDADTLSGTRVADINAHSVDGLHAATMPEPNKLLSLDSNSKFPLSVIPSTSSNMKFGIRDIPDPGRSGGVFQENITGLGFNPKYIMFIAGAGGFDAGSWGVSDSASNNCIYKTQSRSNTNSQYCVYLTDNGAVFSAAVLASTHSDGFMLNWRSPTPNTNENWLPGKYLWIAW